METIRNQGSHQTGDTGGRARDRGVTPTGLLLFECTAHGRDIIAYVMRASMSSSEYTLALTLYTVTQWWSVFTISTLEGGLILLCF